MSRPDPGADDRPSAGGPSKVTPEIAAEAAAWIASLHGAERNQDMEDDFRAWQKISPVHREAFEKMTDLWQAIPGTQAAKAYALGMEREARSAKRARSLTWRWACAAGLGVLVTASAVVVQRWHDKDVYVAAIGEQRSVMLDDGTRMLLNTASKARVDFGGKQRTVEIDAGEALFEVAKDPTRPFIVRAAGSEVVAVGTVFTVRFTDGPKNEDALTVTLVEGEVNVRPMSEGGGSLAPKETVVLKPGDRLTLQHDARSSSSAVESRLDRPDMERAMAWQRHEASFDATPLVDAVADFNRYSRTPIVLSEDVVKEKHLLSGVYRTGDSAAFANAVAMLYGLKVHETDGRLELQRIR
jgi:transmembrane sensor